MVPAAVQRSSASQKATSSEKAEVTNDESAQNNTEAVETNEPFNEEQNAVEESVKSDNTAQQTEEVNTEERNTDTEDVNSPDVVDENSANSANNSKPLEKEESAINNETSESIPDANSNNNNSNDDSKLEEEEAEEKVPVVDERALYTGTGDKDTAGTSSESKGASLDLSGWMWDFEPKPNDTSSENGRIVFEILVDGEGELLKIRTITTTVSPAVEKIYEDAVRELTFSKTAENRSTAAQSKGRITFIIQSK